MTDFATIIRQNAQSSYCDWALDGPDLQSDDGLFTAVTISLLTDRLAAADDEIPDAPIPGQGVPGIADRRGWWGDTVLPQTGGKPDLIGSRLWLLQRSKMTTQTQVLAVKYCQEALQWLIDDAVAQTVNVATKAETIDGLAVGILISRVGPNGQPVNHAYDLVWAATNGVLGTAANITLHEYFTSDAGQPITDDFGRDILVN